MSCERIEQVGDYALRALSANERTAFESHVGGCPECQRELASMAPVVEALVDWPIDVLRPPVPLWDRLAQRLSLDAAGPPEERWADDPAWKDVAPGIACKLLATDATRARVSVLVRLDAGAAYPPHLHADVEEVHLLEGELWIDDRKLFPGDYSRAEPGTADSRVWSETGCTCLLMTSLHDVLR